MTKTKILPQLKEWAKDTPQITALVLTGSRSNPATNLDRFSDYDVAFYTNNLQYFQNDAWLKHFGKVLICWPQKPQPTLDENWLTRLVIFQNRLRLDFQITNTTMPPLDYDFGYHVLIDKTGFTQEFPPATHTQQLIKPPTQEQFNQLIHDFFWDATYFPKHLYKKRTLFCQVYARFRTSF